VETIHAKAKIEITGKVCLWLGAKTMVEFSYEEAYAMLTQNLSDAREKLEENNRDLDHGCRPRELTFISSRRVTAPAIHRPQQLRNQVITVEVNMARVFNWDVKRRRDEKAKGELTGE